MQHQMVLDQGSEVVRHDRREAAYCATIWIEERGDQGSDLLSRQDDDCRAATRMQVLS